MWLTRATSGADKRRSMRCMITVVSVLVGDYMLATSLRHAAYTKEIELVGPGGPLGTELI